MPKHHDHKAAGRADEDLLEIRILGPLAQASQAASRISHVLDVASQSRPLPRRTEPGRVSIYIKVRPEQ